MNVKRIWDDGGYGKDNPFKNTVTFIIKEAAERKINKDIAETVISEVLLEVAGGKEYPKDSCPCGCGINKSGTAITHEMLKRIVTLGKQIENDQTKAIIDRLNSVILNHIKDQNEQYIKEQMPPKKPFLDWARSPTVKGVKKVYELVRNSK